jgi:MFS family permease
MPNPFAIRDTSENPAPKQVYNWRIYALALSASMGSACFGYDSAFIGGTLSLPSFGSRFELAGKDASALANLQSNIVSTFQAGCFFGVIACYALTEKFGRRIVLMLCGALFCVGAVLQVAASGQLGLIYAGRVLTGQ